MRPLLLLCIYFSLWAKPTLESGDFIEITTIISDGKKSDTSSVYGLICQNSQILMDGRIGKFELSDSTLTLSPYGAGVKLIDGKVDRTHGRFTSIFPFDGKAPYALHLHVKTNIKTLSTKADKAYQNYRGYWCQKKNLRDGFFIIGNRIYSPDFQKKVKVEVVSISPEHILTMKMSLGKEVQNDTTALRAPGAIHLTATNIDRYLNTEMPFLQTPTLKELKNKVAALQKVEKPSLSAIQILKAFVTNNYFYFDKKSMESIEALINSPTAARLTEVMTVLGTSLQDYRLTAENIDEKTKAPLQKAGITSLEKYKAETKVLLLYLTTVKSPESKEEKEVFELLQTTLQYL